MDKNALKRSSTGCLHSQEQEQRRLSPPRLEELNRRLSGKKHNVKGPTSTGALANCMMVLMGSVFTYCALGKVGWGMSSWSCHCQGGGSITSE